MEDGLEVRNGPRYFLHVYGVGVGISFVILLIGIYGG